jgi:hypothetical protein
LFDTPRRYLAVGDILAVDDEYFAVLTPACDLTPRDGEAAAEVILLAQCQTLADFAVEKTELSAKIAALSSGKTSSKRQKAIEYVQALMRHARLNDSGRRFFLPPFAEFPGAVIDFLRISTHPHDQENRKKLVESRVLSVNREVAAELATRFGRYMIRLGQARYMSDPLIESFGTLQDTDGGGASDS